MKKLISLILISTYLLVLKAQDFTLVVIPDTQFMVMNFSYKNSSLAQFTAQMDWVPAQKDALNIKFVCHVGDMVDHVDYPNEWATFKNGWTKIQNSGIPWAIAAGNHDGPMAQGNFDVYNTQFPASGWLTNSWAQETYPVGKSDNNVSFFTASGMDFIVVSIGYGMDATEYDWALSVLNKYPNKRAIISTHDVNDGSFTALAQASTNVFLIVSGHYDVGEWNNTFVNNAGVTGHEIMSDYQDYNNGYLRYYTFKPSENKIYAYTYHPLNQTYRTQTSSQFSWDYNMSTSNPVIGNFSINPTAPKSTNAVTVSTTITDDKSISFAKLYWGTFAGSITNLVNMTANGNTYTGLIPAQADGTTVYYKVVATDGDANSTTSNTSNYTVSNANAILYADYDGTDLSFTGWGTASFAKIANPVITGINVSNNVGQLTKGAGTTDGIYSTTLSSKIDFSTMNLIKIKVYSPVIGTFLLKLEDASNSATFKEVTVQNTKINTWEELTFDFSTTTSNTYNRITMIFDFKTFFIF